MSSHGVMNADFEIGPSAISAYSRLNYVMWYALAEFVDNSTQSRLNYGGIIALQRHIVMVHEVGRRGFERV
jgi:hypothetical protein